MKNIICYGDSNTFGFNPADGSRYDSQTRWTSLLQCYLGENYKVAEEGANNRTGFADNPDGFLYSGNRHFESMLAKYSDIDVIILAIGTNDLQYLYDISDENIEKGLVYLVAKAKEKSKRVIIVPPVVMDETILKGYFKIQFDKTSIEKSKCVKNIYEKVANTYNCDIFDFNEFVKPSKIDGLHYDKQSHKLIAEKLSNFIM